MAPHVLVSCEHASNRVPVAYRSLFAGAGRALSSHRGHDIGAAHLARVVARATGAPMHLGGVTRLLVDLNRSPHHRELLSEFSRPLSRRARLDLLERHYFPYRNAVESDIEDALAKDQRVVQLSVHSFTPVLDGLRRRCDIGLLYDPGRARERRLALDWQRLMRQRGGLTVRRNYPYRGVQDGLVTWLRERFPAAAYLGLELEVNQRLATGGRFPPRLESLVAGTFREALETGCEVQPPRR